MATEPITAKCVDKAFDSKNAIQYYPNDVVRIIYSEDDRQFIQDINLADRHQRKLVWLKTLGGRWVFEFDRANASSTQLRIFFCKECGQPFDKLSDIGTHANSQHNKIKVHTDKTKAEDVDMAEEEAIQELLAKEAAEDAEVTK